MTTIKDPRCGVCVRYPGYKQVCNGKVRTGASKACLDFDHKPPPYPFTPVAPTHEAVSPCATCRRAGCDWKKAGPCVWWEGAR